MIDNQRRRLCDQVLCMEQLEDHPVLNATFGEWPGNAFRPGDFDTDQYTIGETAREYLFNLYLPQP